MGMGMGMGMAIITRRGMIVAVVIPPRRRKGAQATVAEVLDDAVDGVEGVAVLPVLTWLNPCPASVSAKGKVFGHLVAHGVL